MTYFCAKLWSLTAKGFNNPRPAWTWAQVTVESRSPYHLVLEGSASNGGFAIDDIKFQAQACPSKIFFFPLVSYNVNLLDKLITGYLLAYFLARPAAARPSMSSQEL